MKPKKSEVRKLLTIAQAADLLTCSPATVYALIDSGQLPVVSIGKSKGYRIDPSDLDAFILERKFTFRQSEDLVVPKGSESGSFKHLKIE